MNLNSALLDWGPPGNPLFRVEDLDLLIEIPGSNFVPRMMFGIGPLQTVDTAREGAFRTYAQNLGWTNDRIDACVAAALAPPRLTLNAVQGDPVLTIRRTGSTINYRRPVTETPTERELANNGYSSWSYAKQEALGRVLGIHADGYQDVLLPYELRTQNWNPASFNNQDVGNISNIMSYINSIDPNWNYEFLLVRGCSMTQSGTQWTYGTTVGSFLFKRLTNPLRNPKRLIVYQTSKETDGLRAFYRYDNGVGTRTYASWGNVPSTFPLSNPSWRPGLVSELENLLGFVESSYGTFTSNPPPVYEASPDGVADNYVYGLAMLPYALLLKVASFQFKGELHGVPVVSMHIPEMWIEADKQMFLRMASAAMPHASDPDLVQDLSTAINSLSAVSDSTLIVRSRDSAFKLKQEFALGDPDLHDFLDADGDLAEIVVDAEPDTNLAVVQQRARNLKKLPALLFSVAVKPDPAVSQTNIIHYAYEGGEIVARRVDSGGEVIPTVEAQLLTVGGATWVYTGVTEAVVANELYNLANRAAVVAAGTTPVYETFNQANFGNSPTSEDAAAFAKWNGDEASREGTMLTVMHVTRNATELATSIASTAVWTLGRKVPVRNMYD